MAVERKRRAWRRTGYAAACVAVLGLALLGAAHTELGRPLLSLLGAAGCPIDAASPARVESFRVEQLSRRQGTELPKSRQALGFELGKTTRVEFIAWTEARARCSVRQSGNVVHCRSMEPRKPRELGIADLHAQFDAAGRLVAIDVFREAADPATALRVLGDTERLLHASVGSSTARFGDRAKDALQRPMSRVSSEYHYAGYVARLSATHLGKLGIRVREQYQSAAADG